MLAAGFELELEQRGVAILFPHAVMRQGMPAERIVVHDAAAPADVAVGDVRVDRALRLRRDRRARAQGTSAQICAPRTVPVLGDARHEIARWPARRWCRGRDDGGRQRNCAVPAGAWRIPAPAAKRCLRHAAPPHWWARSAARPACRSPEFRRLRKCVSGRAARAATRAWTDRNRSRSSRSRRQPDLAPRDHRPPPARARSPAESASTTARAEPLAAADQASLTHLRAPRFGAAGPSHPLIHLLHLLHLLHPLHPSMAPPAAAHAGASPVRTHRPARSGAVRHTPSR